jgi:hypothetical protein
MFCIVNLLTRCLFPPEAPSVGDDMAVMAGAEGEPLEIEEVTEDQIQAESPQKDTKAEADAERGEMRGSGV